MARPGEEKRPFDQSGGVPVGVERAEDVGPGAVAPDGRAQAPIAVGEAAHAPHGNAGAFGLARRRVSQTKARGRAFFGLALAAAGDADIDRGRRARRDVPIVAFGDIAECHPTPLLELESVATKGAGGGLASLRNGRHRANRSEAPRPASDWNRR